MATKKKAAKKQTAKPKSTKEEAPLKSDQRKDESENKVQVFDDPRYFAAVLSYYVKQNQLMWSRVTIILALQGAGLGGAYALRDDSFISNGLVFLVMAATVVIALIVERDRSGRNTNRRLLGFLSERLTVPEGAAYTSKTDGHYVLTTPERRFRTGVKPCHPILQGRVLYPVLFVIALGADIFFLCQINRLSEREAKEKVAKSTEVELAADATARSFEAAEQSADASERSAEAARQLTEALAQLVDVTAQSSEAAQRSAVAAEQSAKMASQAVEAADSAIRLKEAEPIPSAPGEETEGVE